MKYHLVTKVAGQAMTKNISLFLFLSPPVLRDKRIVARSWKTMMQTGLVVRALADCCFGRMMVGPGRQGSAHKRNTRTHKHIHTQTDPQKTQPSKNMVLGHGFLCVDHALPVCCFDRMMMGPGRGRRI